MGVKFNPLIFGGLDLSGGGSGPAGAVEWKSPVATESALPTIGNSPGDARVALDTDKIYVWDDTSSKWIDSGLTTAAFGATPNAAGLTVSSVTVGDITRATINLEPADESNPGAVSITDQTFAGNKTFSGDVIVEGAIDAQTGLDSSTGTLTIGSVATAINIGNSGSTVTIAGTTLYENVTDLLVEDKTITINSGGAVDSAGDAGVEIEEDGSITGYAKISSDRNTWELKAPNQLGVAVIDPGATGITLDESTSNLLPLDGSRAMTGDLVMDTHEIQFDDTLGTTLIINPSNVQFVVDDGAGTILTTEHNFNGLYTQVVQSTNETSTTDIGAASGLDVKFENPNSSYFENSLVSSGQILTEINDGSISKQIKLDNEGINIYSTDGTISGNLNIQVNDYDYARFLATNAIEIEAGSGEQVKIMSELAMNSQKIVDVLDPTDPQDAATKFYVDSLTVDVSQVTKEPTGFPNRDDSTVTFDDLTRTLTISPTSTTFDVYVKGEKFTKTEESVVISTDSGNHYIYYNSSGQLVDDVVFSPNIFSDNALVSIVYWNNDSSSSVYFAEERHGLTMDGATHGYLHTVFGARYLSGLALQGFSVDGTGDVASDAQFVVDQGQIRDEDLLIVIPQQNEIPILYREGSLWRKKTADSYPVIYSGTAGYIANRLPYNNFNGVSWELTEVVNNGYVLVHLFGTNDKDNGVVGIQGINQYNNVTDARNAAATEISSLSGLPFAEFVAIGSVVFETSDTYTNDPQARVRSISGADYVDFRGTQLYTPAGEATTHSLLSGLANDDHIQYLLADGTRAMSGALNMGTHLINNVVDPALAQDAATKNYVDNNVNPVLNYADQQVVYVSKNGNNLTGTGGQHKPFLTIQAAINSIIDASASKKYVVKIAPGTYTEALSLKPWVSLQGYNKETVVVSIPSSTSMTLSGRGRLWLEKISFIGAGSININTTGLSGTNGTVLELRNCGVNNTGAQKFTFVGDGPGRDYAQLRNTDLTQAVNISGASVTIYECTLSNTCVLESSGTIVNVYGELLDSFIRSSYIYNLSVKANTGHLAFFQGFGSTFDSTTTLNGTGLTANFDAISYPSTQSLLNSPTIVRTTKSEATSYNNTTSGLTATNDQAAIDELALNKADKYVGDISRTSFSFADAQLSAANITGLSFSNAVVRGFNLQLTVVRGSSFAEYNINGIQKSSSWEMTQDYVGDDTGVSFSITSAGQVQYVSTNTGSGGTILFRAITV